MEFVSRFFNFFLNRCPSCGLSATTICARCWYVLNDVGLRKGGIPRGFYVSDHLPFAQRALFLWDDRDQRSASILRDVILSSKERPSPEILLLWASELTTRARIDGVLAGKRDWLVIPPPGRSGYGERDHAGALADAIASVNAGYLLSEVGALERIGESRRTQMKSQKLKTREQRLRIEFRVSASAKNRIRHSPGFLFVDDVVATGATAKAAWVALGKPRAFESWAIAYKVRESPYLETDPEAVQRDCDRLI